MIPGQRMAQEQLSHIQMLATGWLPVALWALDEYFQSFARIWLAMLVAACCLQALSNTYLAYFMAVPLAVVFAFSAVIAVPASAKHLAGMIDDLPEDSVWSAAGIGLFQLPMSALAIAMGGHTRVGLEDNIFHGFDRSELATNQGLVERVADMSETFGRRLATSAHARAMLGLGPSAAVMHRVAARSA